MIELEASRSDALGLIEDLAKDSADMNSRVLALHALGVARTDESARVLARFLGALNDRQEAGDSTDARVVRAAIRALGASGSPLGRQELFRVKFVGYGLGVVREAERALAQLP